MNDIGKNNGIEMTSFKFPWEMHTGMLRERYEKKPLAFEITEKEFDAIRTGFATRVENDIYNLKRYIESIDRKDEYLKILDILYRLRKIPAYDLPLRHRVLNLFERLDMLDNLRRTKYETLVEAVPASILARYTGTPRFTGGSRTCRRRRRHRRTRQKKF